VPRSGRYVDLKKKHGAPVRAVPLQTSPPSNIKEKAMTEAAHQGTAEATDKVIYTAKTHTTVGRENGVSRSSDGRLDVRLSLPGSPRIGTNPEQLFAAGWSACFEGAIAVVAHKKKIKIPSEVAIDAEVDLHQGNTGEYFLSARLNISIPGVDRSIAQGLVDDAKGVCPYSKATKGNIAVTYNLV
jgi:lipoyl-dependent peroxiredoxin